jgi:hypothetical protein
LLAMASVLVPAQAATQPSQANVQNLVAGHKALQTTAKADIIYW